MVSIFDHFSNELTKEDKVILDRSGLGHLEQKLAKIILVLLHGDDLYFEEQNIVQFKGLIDILKESSDIQASLNYINEITNGEERKDSKSEKGWKRKILTEFVCEFYGGKGCTEYGAKISQSLIRVAATRIFADPEQSIMELPVNSIDSYNLLAGGRSVGKFGMGFFSIFYWLSEPLAGEFKRKMTLKTSYYVDKEIQRYRVEIKWTSQGLLIEKYALSEEEFNPNGKIGTTGTFITLDFSEHQLSDYIVNKMKEYMSRLFLVEGAEIYLNKIGINRYAGGNKVNVVITKTLITIEDNAAGIPFTILENSLLVPSSSTKKRDFVQDEYKSPLIERSTGESFFVILVNGVAIVKLNILSDFSYIIKLPYNSKLPVSRDDILFGSYEIEYFKKACVEIIKHGLSVNNIASFFIALEIYIAKNKSSLLINLLKLLRREIESSPYILLPQMSFWKTTILNSSQAAKQKLVIYDQPNMFITEQKLAPLLEGASKSNIFKLRKVIVTKINQISESGGLSQYLFVSDKFKDDITSISIKENRTLLIPCDDDYEIEIYGQETMERFNNYSVREIYSPGGYTIMSFIGYSPFELKFRTEVFNGLHPQIHHVLSIVKSSMERKFENYDYSKYGNTNTDLFIERYASIIAVSFSNLGKSYNEIIPYLIDLNTKLMSYPISKKSAYGVKPRIEIESSFSCFFNVINNGPLIDHSNMTPQIKLIKEKMLRDSITFTNDLLVDTKSINHLKLPNFDYTIFANVNPLDTYQKPQFKKDLINEIYIAANSCNFPIETFVIVSVIIKITSEKFSIADLKTLGLGNYLLEEMRSRITPVAMMNLIRELYGGQNTSFISRIFDPLCEIGKSYIEFISTKDIDMSLSMFSHKWKFSAKQLIEFVFNNNVKIGKNNNDLFQRLSNEFHQYQRSERKLQILEIAVNEGTTKGFIQSVLTELIQNSTDAIRSTDGNPNIEIYIGKKSVSIKDFIGFDNLINIMIPFLSSKNPNDPNVTGEMGSGFFNIYRQPFVKEILVTSTLDGTKRTFRGVPLVENNLVYDIEYYINEVKLFDGVTNETEVSLVFNDELGMMPEIIAEATIFTNCYLSFIPGIVLKCNQKLIQKNFNNTYEGPGIKFYTVDDIVTTSYVMTNGIPLMPLSDFINSLENLNVDNYNLGTLLEIYCQSSIIIDIGKDLYTPTQSRNKIQFKPTINMKEFNKSILNGIYFSLLDLYCRENFKSMRDYLIIHSSSYANPQQLSISPSDHHKNFIGLYNSSFMEDDKQYGSIKMYMDALAYSSNYPEDVTTIQGKVTSIWFTKKQYPKPYIFDPAKPEGPGNESKKQKKPSVPFTILQPFIDIYWAKTVQLQAAKIIECKKFGKNPTAPRIWLADLQPGLLGQYNPTDHTIEMNMNECDPNLLRTELLKFKGKDMRKVTTSFIMNKTIKQYFSSCIPTTTLIHEFGHAVDGNSHNGSSHGTTSIKIRGSEYLEFEDMCSQVYQESIALGLINEFLATVN